MDSINSSRKPVVIVLEPTRDLAQQTHEAFGTFGKYLDPKVETALLVGGLPVNGQIQVEFTIENNG